MEVPCFLGEKLRFCCPTWLSDGPAWAERKARAGKRFLPGASRTQKPRSLCARSSAMDPIFYLSCTKNVKLYPITILSIANAVFRTSFCLGLCLGYLASGRRVQRNTQSLH